MLDLSSRVGNLLDILGPLHERFPRYVELLTPYISQQEKMELESFRHNVGVLAYSLVVMSGILMDVEKRGLK